MYLLQTQHDVDDEYQIVFSLIIFHELGVGVFSYDDFQIDISGSDADN